MSHKVAIFDAWSGVSGDMWVGALLDAGVPLQPLRAAVQSLDLPGVDVQTQEVLRGGLRGTQFLVVEQAHSAAFVQTATPRAPQRSAAEHAHRRLNDIVAVLAKAAVPARVRQHCEQIYSAIADVEARAHGIDKQQVHFHEVGAVDTIVDVLCGCFAADLLGVERFLANGIELGSGQVRAAHGVLPVPAPATEALLVGVPTRRGGLAGERTTPTGAALLAQFCTGFDEPVALRTTAVGYGAGSRDTTDAPNLLRVTIGEAVVAGSSSLVVELQCQVDNATGEQLGWLLDEALQRGALDAYFTPVQMKKGRPGVLLTLLVEPARVCQLRELLLAESGSLGLRERSWQRHVLERWQETRDTAFGPLQYKVARLPNGELLARPEADELARLCRTSGLTRAALLRALGC